MDADLLRRRYDETAATYDAQFIEQQRPKILQLRQALPDPLPARAVDLGAGTGLFSRLTAHPFINVDFSLGMLKLAPPPRVAADLRRLPFPDNSFDLAVSVTALIDIADHRPYVTEMRRILVPDGWLAISLLKFEQIESFAKAMHTHFKGLDYLDLGQDLGFIGRAR